MISLFTTIKWGWNNSSITFKMKSNVARAACSQVTYDYGLKHSFATSQLPAWEDKINSAIEENIYLDSNLFHSLLIIQEVKHMLTTSNISIRIIFRNCFVMLRILREAKHLTKEGSIPSETRCNLSLHRLQLYRWFIDNSG